MTTDNLKASKCQNGDHVGPIYEHLVTETRIELDPKTLKIKEDAEAQIVEQYRDCWECEACGLTSNNPFHLAKEV